MNEDKDPEFGVTRPAAAAVPISSAHNASGVHRLDRSTHNTNNVTNSSINLRPNPARLFSRQISDNSSRSNTSASGFGVRRKPEMKIAVYLRMILAVLLAIVVLFNFRMFFTRVDVISQEMQKQHGALHNLQQQPLNNKDMFQNFVAVKEKKSMRRKLIEKVRSVENESLQILGAALSEAHDLTMQGEESLEEIHQRLRKAFWEKKKRKKSDAPGSPHSQDQPVSFGKQTQLDSHFETGDHRAAPDSVDLVRIISDEQERAASGKKKKRHPAVATDSDETRNQKKEKKSQATLKPKLVDGHHESEDLHGASDGNSTLHSDEDTRHSGHQDNMQGIEALGDRREVHDDLKKHGTEQHVEFAREVGDKDQDSAASVPKSVDLHTPSDHGYEPAENGIESKASQPPHLLSNDQHESPLLKLELDVHEIRATPQEAGGLQLSVGSDKENEADSGSKSRQSANQAYQANQERLVYEEHPTTPAVPEDQQSIQTSKGAESDRKAPRGTIRAISTSEPGQGVYDSSLSLASSPRASSSTSSSEMTLADYGRLQAQLKEYIASNGSSKEIPLEGIPSALASNTDLNSVKVTLIGNPYRLLGEDIAEKFIPVFDARRIALWPEMAVHGRAPQSYIMSAFLDKDENRTFSALLFVFTRDMPVDQSAPILSLTLRFPQQSARVQCDFIHRPEEPTIPYSGHRDLQVHRCSVPGDVKVGGNSEVPVTVKAKGQNSTATFELREWHDLLGYRQPKKVYTYTIATFLKSNYQKCLSVTTETNQTTYCDSPIYQRLPEWVAYHLLLGFEHIYIYCTDTWTNTSNLLMPFIQRDQVTVIAAPELDVPPLRHVENTQVVGYSSHGSRFRRYSVFQFFADGDEMLYVNPNISLHDEYGRDKNSTDMTNITQWDDLIVSHKLPTLLSKLIYKMDLMASKAGKTACSIYFPWWTVTPDSLESAVSATSVIHSYHLSTLRGPPITTRTGLGKVMTDVKYGSVYATQHLRTFKAEYHCMKMFPSPKDASLIHYRIVPRGHWSAADRFPFHQMDGFLPNITALLKAYRIW